MKHIKDVVINSDRGTVTLFFVERNYWGAISARQQITLNKREFEAALRAAEMTVPWQDVAR